MSALATPDRPGMPLDVYLRTLREAGPRDNPWQDVEGGGETWATFCSLGAALADFVDDCRGTISYEEALGTIAELVGFLPDAPIRPIVPAALALSAEDMALLLHGKGDGGLQRKLPPIIDTDPTLF